MNNKQTKFKNINTEPAEYINNKKALLTRIQTIRGEQIEYDESLVALLETDKIEKNEPLDRSDNMRIVAGSSYTSYMNESFESREEPAAPLNNKKALLLQLQKVMTEKRGENEQQQQKPSQT